MNNNSRNLPASTCTSPPSIVPGGNATVRKGFALGPCPGFSLNGGKKLKTASCDVEVRAQSGIASKILETSERLAQVFKFFQTYPASETRNLNYLITTSYPFQLENVSCLRGSLPEC